MICLKILLKKRFIIVSNFIILPLVFHPDRKSSVMDISWNIANDYWELNSIFLEDHFDYIHILVKSVHLIQYWYFEFQYFHHTIVEQQESIFISLKIHPSIIFHLREVSSVVVDNTRIELHWMLIVYSAKYPDTPDENGILNRNFSIDVKIMNDIEQWDWHDQ